MQYKYISSLCLVCLAVGSASAQAQTVVESTALDEVVVSTSRREQRSFDSPAAVQAVSGDTIRNAGAQVNLSEALNRIPGVVVLNRQNYSQDLQLSVRGFGARSTFGVRGVRLMIDGIPATTPDGQGQASTFSLPFTERVEVLRGPMAQLYGNAAGGIVQAFTKNPVKEPSAEFSLYTGANGTLRTDLQGGARLGSFSLGADYNTFHTDGERAHSAAKRDVLNLKLGYGSDGTKLTWTVSAFNQPKAEDPLGLTRAEYNANAKQATPSAISQNTGKDVQQNQTGLRLEQALGKYLNLDARIYAGNRDLDNPLATQWVTLDRKFSGIGLNLNGKANLGGSGLNWVLGYDRDTMKERRRGYTNTAGVRGVAFNRDEDNASNNGDFFAQASLVLGEAWTVTAGARRSSIELESQDYYLTDGRNGTGLVKYSATNPVLGIVWGATDTLNVYANYGKGLETPTLSEVAYRQLGTAVIGEFNPALAAARSKHLELGSKWQIAKGYRVDAALFKIDSQGELVPQRTSSGQSVFQNAGQTRRQGLELAANAQFSKELSARLAYTYTDAQFTSKYARIIGTATTTINAGNGLPAVPKHLMSTELVWRPMTGTRLAAEWGAASRLWANDTNTDYAAGYGTLNLAAAQSWSFGKLALTVQARMDNVANRKYIGSVIVNEANQRFYEPAQGGSWLLGVNLKGTF